MIIIGEKINGAIPSIKEAIANRDEALIRERVQVQLPAKPDFLDCAPATEPALEYDAMKWLIGIMEEETDTPLCLDSPDPLLLKRLLEEGATQRPGCINSVNEEGTKCETLFPLIAGTDWNVIGLTCDQDGIPLDPDKKIEIAKRIIDKADTEPKRTEAPAAAKKRGCPFLPTRSLSSPKKASIIAASES